MGPPEPFLDAAGLGSRHTCREAGLTALTIPSYLSRMHLFDCNGDGRNDFAFWNAEHFDAHLQDESAQFDPRSRYFVVDVPFDIDGACAPMFGFEGELHAHLGVSGASLFAKQPAKWRPPCPTNEAGVRLAERSVADPDGLPVAIIMNMATP